MVLPLTAMTRLDVPAYPMISEQDLHRSYEDEGLFVDVITVNLALAAVLADIKVMPA